MSNRRHIFQREDKVPDADEVSNRHQKKSFTVSNPNVFQHNSTEKQTEDALSYSARQNTASNASKIFGLQAASKLSLSTRQNAILNLQQQHGNDYVRRVLGQSTLPKMAEQRVSRLRPVGMWTGTLPEGGQKGRQVPIFVRTQEEWIEFLKKHADEEDGSRELYTFMAIATGGYPSINYVDSHLKIDAGPSRQEATDLMIALLTTGAEIDLPDKNDEGDVDIKLDYGHVMSRFTGQYTGLALQQMTRDKDGKTREFDSKDVGNIAAYGEQVKGMPNLYGPAQTGGQGQGAGAGVNDAPNPALALISAAVASAFGAAVQVLQAGSDPKKQPFKHDAYLLMRNSAMTIRGILDSIEHPAQTPPSLLIEIFSGTVNALAAATGFLKVGYQIAAWGLSGVAGSWFSLISVEGRDVKQDIRQLKDDFHNQLNNIKTVTLVDGSEKPIENMSDVETIKTIFDTILNY